MNVSAFVIDSAEGRALRDKLESMAIEMPAKEEVQEVDIDAQLFQYVASADKGSGIMGLGDLDDAWVQSMFPNVKSLADLRKIIKDSLQEENEIAWENLKFQRCADVLADVLDVEVSEAEVESALIDMLPGYEMQLHAQHLTKEGYMEQEGLTEEEFNDLLKKDVAFRLRQEQAFELCAKVLEVSVEDGEIGDYLACDDPEEFLAELKEVGKVEEARQAAANVKAMRIMMDKVTVKVL